MNLAKEILNLRTKLDEIERAYLLTEAEVGKITPIDVAPVKPSPAKPEAAHVTEGGDCVCSECGKPVSKKVMAYSMKRFHDVFCFDCQKKLRREA